ncbi:MAG: TonB-dependent receptor [Bacteroidetes bacterium]|nr:TonB-dependent receptor [Bacteroidota bacterium]
MNWSRYCLWIVAVCMAQMAFAQTDTSKVYELPAVSVTGLENSHDHTSINIQSLSLYSLETKSPYNLSDALAKIPGISQMNTGNAISKPVIRGLYGNRILVLLSGLRFDNQQFQDEHGLGLSQIGIQQVDVVKGPASILYGTDAMGGVINVIEETPSAKGSNLDANVRLYSNTLGTLTDVGYIKSNGKTWYRIRGGVENHADYADGNNTRVLNSRNSGYYLKLGGGFNHRKWSQNNSYNFSYNRYGFILDSLTRLYVNNGRYSRSMEGPHHNVMLNVFSSINSFKLRKSDLKVTIGSQSNKRAEDEGSGEISLNMHLLSILENAKWEKQLTKKTSLIVNQQFTYENNTNYGKRILIPDAHMLEGNLAAFIRYKPNWQTTIEAGAGYNYKQIQTYKTKMLNIGSINTPDTTMRPFSIGRQSYNAMLGISYIPADRVTLKANVSTGNRAPNLAELSSNGLHEGTYRVEVGTPSLKMEQNINSDVSFEMERGRFYFTASAFYNHINNYIYLAKTNEPAWYGFDRYRYMQQNAALYGGEIRLMEKFTIRGHNIYLNQNYSQVEGRLNDGSYLPFMPANKLHLSATYNIGVNPHNVPQEDQTTLIHYRGTIYIEPELEYILAQNKPANFETATVDFALVNLHLGYRYNSKNDNTTFITLTCRNLLNKAYADHLSRLKYYGFNNQGINIILTVKTNLHK